MSFPFMPTSDLADQFRERIRYVQSGVTEDSKNLTFLHFGKKQEFAGQAVVVRCYDLEDETIEYAGESIQSKKKSELHFSKLLDAVQNLKNMSGHVLIADGYCDSNFALMGDRMAGFAKDAGFEGIIVFGGIRDTAGINKVDIGVKALGTNPRRAENEGKGRILFDVDDKGIEINEKTLVGGIEFANDGSDLVFADADGIVVLKKEQLAELL